MESKLRAAGASPLASVLHGVLPQAAPQLVAYTLYRWEVNVRAAAVLGVVGAGGIGRDLKLALSWFDYPRAATLVLAILALVLLAAHRCRLAGGQDHQGHEVPLQVLAQLVGRHEIRLAILRFEQ